MYPDVNIRRRVVYSLDPARVLLDASAHGGLTVVGSRRRGEVRSVLFGSVGYALIDHGSCPVALAHAMDN